MTRILFILTVFIPVSLRVSTTCLAVLGRHLMKSYFIGSNGYFQGLFISSTPSK